jgi:hypothetical protein
LTAAAAFNPQSEYLLIHSRTSSNAERLIASPIQGDPTLFLLQQLDF